MIITDIFGRMKRAIKRRWAFQLSMVDDPYADDFTVIDGKLTTWREFNAQARAAYEADGTKPDTDESGRIVRHARAVSR